MCWLSWPTKSDDDTIEMIGSGISVRQLAALTKRWSECASLAFLNAASASDVAKLNLVRAAYIPHLFFGFPVFIEIL